MNRLSVRDKKLLIFLGILLMVFICFFAVFRPLLGKRAALQEKISEAGRKQEEDRRKLSDQERLRLESEALIAQTEAAGHRFFPEMTSMQIDEKLTSMALACLLQCTDLDIRMPDAGTSGALPAYTAGITEEASEHKSEPDQETGTNRETESGNTGADRETEAGRESETGGQEEAAKGMPIRTAEAEMTLVGPREGGERLIDDFSAAEPALRIVSFDWQHNGTEQEDNYMLHIRLELYMYENMDKK